MPVPPQNTSLLAGGALLLALLAAGCAHLDIAAEGDPNRVVTGRVEFSSPNPLPDDAQVLVRVVDEHPDPTSMTNQAVGNPQPLLNQPMTATANLTPPGPEVLGEQTIKHPGSSPVAFKIEYTADDQRLRHGLNLEVRISYEGRMQLFNSNQYSISLTDFRDPHVVEADPMR